MSDVATAPSSPIAARLTSLAVASALFMEFVDSTALSTALPTLARAFHADPLHLKLALTSYILALAVCTPVSGWAAERFGARRIFMLAMVVFLGGSALCGMSRDLPQLVGSRLLQGLGGAMMTPVARLIVVSAVPRERLLSAMGWFTMPALVGPLLGPPLAGWILSVADWPWIFYINLPVGLMGLIAVWRFVPAGGAGQPGPFDAMGFALASLAITGMVALAETTGVGLIPGWAQIMLLLSALGSGIAYLRRTIPSDQRPILDLELLRFPTFRASLLGGGLVRLGIGAGPLLLPLLLQVALGWSPLQAGTVSLASGVGVFGARPVVAWLLRRFGFRLALLVSVALVSVFSALPAIIGTSTPAWLIAVMLGLTGFFRASQFISVNTIAFADVPEDRVAAASTLAAVAQQVSLALGVSFGGLMLHWARGSWGGGLTADRFTWPYLAVGVVTLIAAPVYLGLDRNAGSSISGRAARVA